jgi:DNA primase
MTVPAPAARAGPPGQDEDREQRLAALGVRLHEVAGQIRTAGDWDRCLRAAARLHGESWANVLLISSRIADATAVKGYQAWQADGRQVSRDEKGIEIFSGARRNEPGSRHGGGEDGHRSWRAARRVAYVWDVSQTSGQPVPLPSAVPAPPAEARDGLWDCLCWMARREGFAVEREDGCPVDGVTFWAARRIRVLPDLPVGQAAWALAHQLGHVLVHNTITYPPGSTTAGCQGVRRAEADSVAFIIAVRYGIPAGAVFSSPQTWAGRDPRAQPAAAILAAGERITTAAAKITRLVDQHLAETGLTAHPAAEAATTAGRQQPEQPAAPQDTAPPAAGASRPGPDLNIMITVLGHAEQFYTSQLARSWVPAYLAGRGIGEAAMNQWHFGYAPAGWTALTSHLRALGHDDDAIQAAGLARLSSRGTLIDHFRDRLMLPVRDGHGNLAGFTGRARPGTDVPKYLNSPETGTYRKGELLFGLHEASGLLARGAVPVIVEGPFDAIAVTTAGRGSFAGLAPCGTALTSRQAAALAQAAGAGQAGIIVAFDDDTAGRKAAVRAYDTLRPFSGRLQSAVLSGKDPAEILQAQGAAALRAILRDSTQPLAAVVIDAHLAPWERRLQDPEGPLLAMRSTAALIAGLLPPGTAQAIRQITGNSELATADEQMRPVANPELPEIARALPADIAYQVAQVAERLGFADYSDVLAEVANAVTRTAPTGTRPAGRPAQLAADSFPHPPVTTLPGGDGTTRQRDTGTRLTQAQAPRPGR